MGEPGSVMAVYFEAGGMQFVGINGGPQFPFTEAISLQIDCADQAEVDRFWDRFIADGGEESMCGWLKDKYGLSWQVVPRGMEELFADPDPAPGAASRAGDDADAVSWTSRRCRRPRTRCP